MKVISYLQNAYEILTQSVVALGNFDGVHLGHQALIKRAVELAKKNGLTSVVFTFQSLPLNVIKGEVVVKQLQSIDEKIDTIASLGVDYLVCLPFDKTMMNMAPERFAREILVNALKCKIAVCGFNYTFGIHGAAHAFFLKGLGDELGFKTEIISEYTIEGDTVSSTLLRKCLEDGRVADFKKYTGRNFTMKGKVMYGEKLGRRMGFPTANINLDPDMQHPGNGVYITRTCIDGKWYPSITNVGNKPTVGLFGKNAETHIFDFEGDIYSVGILVEYIELLRPEKKFPSVELLSKQIALDCNQAREYHKTH